MHTIWLIAAFILAFYCGFIVHGLFTMNERRE